jgi:hypothetical protein
MSDALLEQLPPQRRRLKDFEERLEALRGYL